MFTRGVTVESDDKQPVVRAIEKGITAILPLMDASDVDLFALGIISWASVCHLMPSCSHGLQCRRPDGRFDLKR